MDEDFFEFLNVIGFDDENEVTKDDLVFLKDILKKEQEEIKDYENHLKK